MHSVSPYSPATALGLLAVFAMVSLSAPVLSLFSPVLSQPAARQTVADPRIGNSGSGRPSGDARPGFDTAEKQFSFAAYEVRDPNLRQECYRALIKNFPNDKRWCALASINLALLYLGDFRDPAEVNANLALRNLELIPESYSSETDLCARSLWLCGWICKDFLKDHQRARKFFSTVTERFGKINRDGDETITWGGLSILQICKMAPEFERWREIQKMIEEYPADLATLFAVSENLDLIPLDRLEQYAADMMKSGPVHAIHSSRILTRILKVSSNPGLMSGCRTFLLDRFKDFPTREVRAAVKAASEGLSR